MTKALVIIEVDIDTAHFPVQEGLGENSNPQHPPMRAIAEGKRERIWDVTHDLLKEKSEFVRIVKVSLSKAGA